MLPIALAAAWFGGYGFVALVTVAGVALAWEWSRLVYGAISLGGRSLMTAAALLPLLARLDPVRGLFFIVAAMAVTALAPLTSERSRFWLPLGALYILLPQLALIVIREQGFGLLLWVFLLVWATDSAAYFSGRLIGGPKLAPSISPNKTWAGLIGGMAAAGLVGWSIGQRDPGATWALVALSAAMAVVSQAGDLAESGLKRYFGVKDSSHLIPGHGGVFDRLDGMLFVAPAVLGLLWLWPNVWGAFYGW